MDTPPIPPTLAPFFQEYDFAKLNPQADAHTIIERTLQFGNRAELRWLFAVYIDAITAADEANPDVATRKEKRIPFGALLENGLILPGQKLYFAKGGKMAKVLANGHIRCGEVTGSIHAVARALLDGAPANGWDLWLYNDENGERHSLDALRQVIRKNNVEPFGELRAGC